MTIVYAFLRIDLSEVMSRFVDNPPTPHRDKHLKYVDFIKYIAPNVISKEDMDGYRTV